MLNQEQLKRHKTCGKSVYPDKSAKPQSTANLATHYINDFENHQSKRESTVSNLPKLFSLWTHTLPNTSVKGVFLTVQTRKGSRGRVCLRQAGTRISRGHLTMGHGMQLALSPKRTRCPTQQGLGSSQIRGIIKSITSAPSPIYHQCTQNAFSPKLVLPTSHKQHPIFLWITCTNNRIQVPSPALSARCWAVTCCKLGCRNRAKMHLGRF